MECIFIPTNVNPLSILVVEDEAMVQTMLKLTLEAGGHQITVVSDMPSALREIQEKDFDVVVTDLLLGKSHGVVVMEAAKAKTPKPRVVAISGGSVLAAGALGADATLEKPFSRAALLSAVESGSPKRKALEAKG